MALRRREVLSYGLAGLGAGLAGCLDEETPVDPTIGDVTSYKYDRRNSGYAADHRGPRENVTERWSKEIHLGFNTPLVKEGIIYAADFAGEVVALNALDGSVRWENPLEMAVWSRLALAEDVLIVPTRDGDVVGLDVATGSERWTAETEGRFELGGPTIGEGICVVPDIEGRVYAFDVDDGTRSWVFEVQEPLWVPPTVAGEVLFIPDGSGTIYALDHRDGAEMWSLELGQRTAAEGVLTSDDQLLLATKVNTDSGEGNEGAHRLVAIDTETRRVRWQFETPETIYRTAPTVTDEVVYQGVETDRDGDPALYAIDLETGDELWSTVESGQGIRASPPVVTDDTIYVGSDWGTFQALDIEDGTEYWRIEADWFTRSPPVVTDEFLFVPAGLEVRKGSLHAFGAE